MHFIIVIFHDFSYYFLNICKLVVQYVSLKSFKICISNASPVTELIFHLINFEILLYIQHFWSLLPSCLSIFYKHVKFIPYS